MTTPLLERVRTGAAVAVLVLAGLSRGDALVLAALVALMAWRRSALVVLPALVASSWRWGSTSLDALAGAQAVLGPAGWVGPTAAAATSWLAATAVLLSAPRPLEDTGATGRSGGAPNVVLSSLAVGAAVAAVAAGPASGGDVWVRALATAVAALATIALARLLVGRPKLGRGLDVLAGVAAAGALGAVTVHAPGWAGTVDTQAIVEGVAVALAAASLVVVGTLARGAMGAKAGLTPTLQRPDDTHRLAPCLPYD